MCKNVMELSKILRMYPFLQIMIIIPLNCSCGAISEIEIVNFKSPENFLLYTK